MTKLLDIPFLIYYIAMETLIAISFNFLFIIYHLFSSKRGTFVIWCLMNVLFVSNFYLCKCYHIIM